MWHSPCTALGFTHQTAAGVTIAPTCHHSTAVLNYGTGGPPCPTPTYIYACSPPPPHQPHPTKPPCTQNPTQNPTPPTPSSPTGLALEGDELPLDLHHGLGVAAVIALDIPAGGYRGGGGGSGRQQEETACEQGLVACHYFPGPCCCSCCLLRIATLHSPLLLQLLPRRIAKAVLPARIPPRTSSQPCLFGCNQACCWCCSKTSDRCAPFLALCMLLLVQHTRACLHCHMSCCVPLHAEVQQLK